MSRTRTALALAALLASAPRARAATSAVAPARAAPGVTAPLPGAPQPSRQSGGQPAAVPAAPPGAVTNAAPLGTATSPVLSPLAFAAGLTVESDAVLLPAARRPPPRPSVVAATQVAASPHALTQVFLNPGLLREALPALIRADVIGSRPVTPHSASWPDRLLAWEVEVPLFNLAGKAWLQQRPDGADLTLVEGAFAPGTIRFRVAPAPQAGDLGAAGGNERAILLCEIQVEVRSSNWIFRKVARHDPWAETAMSAAMAWVVARAVGLRAEAVPGQPPARPRAPFQAPSATALDGIALAQPALSPLRAAGTLVGVRRAPTGRLAWASVAVPLRVPAAAVSAHLDSVEGWTAFPGWKTVKRRPPAPGAPQGSPLVIEVKDDISLVDLDAVWSVHLRPSVRATAIDGDTRGAVFAWQVWPGETPSTSLAVFSMHPRLDAAGYVERKLVAAEPLLEHALGLALTYVDGAAMAAAFGDGP